MKKIKLLSLFSGIGAFEEALKEIGIDFDLVNYCEFDDKIAKCYSLIHNEPLSKNLGDINKVDETSLPDFDLMTFGFPCQTFSIAGKREGFNDETRGNLFFESVRIAKYKQPKYMIIENVKGLLSHDKGETFRIVIETLNKIGYNTYWKVIKSTDFDIPQARERVFIVCIRKDIDNKNFNFPEGRQTDKTVKDILENLPRKEMKSSLKPYNNPTYFTKEYKDSVFNMKKLFDGVGEGYFTSSFTSNRIYSINGVSPTLTTKNDAVYSEINGHLTQRERFKLQGFNPDYVDLLLNNGITKGLLDKVSGNSITVNVLEAIFRNLFLD